MKLIDFENHFYDQCLIDALEARTEPPYYRRDTDLITWSEQIQMPQGPLLDKLLEVGEGRIALMDKLGIDCAVLSCSPGAEQLDEDVSIDVCRRTNDALYALTQRFPGRYLGTAALPVANVEAAVAEMERCVKELGFVGCVVIMIAELLIIGRCIQVGVRCQDYMRRLVCYGAASALMFQLMINVGMCIGVMPVIGLTLPLISYGGSSVVTIFAMLGLVSGAYARPSSLSHERYVQPYRG